MTENNKRASAINRFEAMFIPEPNSGCWLWEASLAGSLGYGQFYADGRLYGAHRYSWMIYRGEIPSGIFVCHRCDNPICVNPNHLFLGSPKQNADDMVAKGRHRKKWTHCKRGHAYDEVGVRPTNGRRWCLACARVAARRQYEKRVARQHALSKGSQP